ncbi:MAG: signal recognition particle-docking protein FtsY [Lachnospiraceae bacterium]|nr:signal recognition particle-docking protein FtsY [Lachnospiraceae bacterium]
MGFFGKLFSSLADAFSQIDDEFYDELEEQMILGDVGVETSERIIEELRTKVFDRRIMRTSDCRELLKEAVREQMQPDEHAYDFENERSVVLVIGVNGVGKTTSVGKMAAMYKNEGKRVLMCAADTFRAAAIEQLTEWSRRAGVELIAQSEGSDPAAVVFDAARAAASRRTDILLVDTAGRLHNKKNLMEELAKIDRILAKEYEGARRETLIVLDATTGQNAMSQARQFMEAADVTGVILTKMDGSAKGGIAVAIQAELGLPVKFVGTGEKLADLKRFDPQEYVETLFAADEA